MVAVALAILPVAAYLLMLGFIHARGQAVVTSGYRDRLVLGLALTGLVVVGPMSLFFPHTAAVRFKSAVWLLLLALWFFSLLLWVLSQRPRLIIYSGMTDQVVAQVQRVLQELDPQIQWLESHAKLPRLGMSLQIEEVNGWACVQVEATSAEQNLSSWGELQTALRRGLADVPRRRTLLGLRILAFALAVVMLVVAGLFQEEQSLWAQLADLFRV